MDPSNPVPDRFSPSGRPARFAPSPDWDAEFGAEPRPEKGLLRGCAWRAVRRHWWQALFLWVLGTAGMATLAYYKVKPTYEAVAQFESSPGKSLVHQPDGNG